VHSRITSFFSYPYFLRSLLHPSPHDHARQLRAQARVNPGPLPHNRMYIQMKPMDKAQLTGMSIVILHYLNRHHGPPRLLQPFGSYKQHNNPHGVIRPGAPLAPVRLAWRFRRRTPIRRRPRDVAARSTCSRRGVCCATAGGPLFIGQTSSIPCSAVVVRQALELL
jgi:hypothetical protein